MIAPAKCYAQRPAPCSAHWTQCSELETWNFQYKHYSRTDEEGRKSLLTQHQRISQPFQSHGDRKTGLAAAIRDIQLEDFITGTSTTETTKPERSRGREQPTDFRDLRVASEEDVVDDEHHTTTYMFLKPRSGRLQGEIAASRIELWVGKRRRRLKRHQPPPARSDERILKHGSRRTDESSVFWRTSLIWWRHGAEVVVEYREKFA